jgi:hypothetical protein
MMPPSTALNAAIPVDSLAQFVFNPETMPTPSAPVGQPIATVVAQSDPDVLADIGGAFKGFYDSGQLWALLIGIVIGYVVRGITTYK